MPYLIGTDEAGYGPNYGPLVISATLWRVPKQAKETDLYELLANAVSRGADGKERGRLPIADSKELYKPGCGLADLEMGVLAALAHVGRAATSWREIWHALDPDSAADLADQPWHDGFDARLPHAVPPDGLAQHVESFSSGLAAAKVELLAMRSAVVFPRRFNRLVEQHGNKATALSTVSLQLVAAVAGGLTDEAISIVCDKHGGRNAYGPLLQQAFPDYLVEVVREGRQESSYRWGPAKRRVEITFVAKGERYLPSALASMACKYLRELAMLPFNQFWQRHVPGLAPTAGYPEDAARFKRDIAAAQRKLGICDELLWRCR